MLSIMDSDQQHPVYEYIRRKFIVDFDALQADPRDRISLKQFLEIVRKKFPSITEEELNAHNARLHLTAALAERGYAAYKYAYRRTVCMHGVSLTAIDVPISGRLQ